MSALMTPEMYLSDAIFPNPESHQAANSLINLPVWNLAEITRISAKVW